MHRSILLGAVLVRDLAMSACAARGPVFAAHREGRCTAFG